MNIHIFNAETFYSYSFLRFLERNFDISSSIIIFRKKRNNNFSYSQDLKSRILYSDNNLRFFLILISVLKKSSRIFFHQLPYGRALFVLNLFRNHLSKATWIIWGADLYVYKEGNETLLKSVYEFLRKRIIRKITRFATLIPGEYELASKIYNTEAAFIRVTYPPPLDFLHFPGTLDYSTLKEEASILIGNSGNPSNNHLEIFSKLKPLKDSNIRIFCPLSYSGDPVYINSVINSGHEIFGNKFIPLLNLIEPAKYLEIIRNIDIAIMNHDRQQGIGNIFPLLYFGKKVFLRSNTTTFHYLADIGCRIFDILSVDTFNESLLSVENIDMIGNQEIIGKLLSEKNCIIMWQQILNQQKKSI
jgi:dTDP-N-acetylfucosamine:lipid II N-acetylfucosaminyltransferase